MSRERERVCEAENPERESSKNETIHGTWIKVTRNKPTKLPLKTPSATKTIHISHLPPDSLPSDLDNMFRKFGQILNIIIPPTQNPNPRFRYAFIRFSDPKSPLQAIRKMDGIKLEGRRLKVQIAKSEKYFPKHHIHTHRNTNLHTKHIPTTKNHLPPSFRDHRSYKEVSSTTPPKPTQHPTITPKFTKPELNTQSLENIQEIEAQPDFFLKKPSAARIVSSKILGEATENARNKIRDEIIDDEFALIIEGNRSSENDDLFKRSLIAVAQSSQSSSAIMESILANGVNFLSIKPLGGLMHLITFETYEDKIAMVESNWLENWFIDLRNVNKSVAQQWRSIDLIVRGVPFSAWNYENFHQIGSVFGRVVSIEYSNFTGARISLISDCLFKINCKMFFNLEEKKYPIFISETEQNHPTVANPSNHQMSGGKSTDKEKESDIEDDDFEPGNANCTPKHHLGRNFQWTHETSTSARIVQSAKDEFQKPPPTETFINPLFEKCGILFTYPTKDKILQPKTLGTQTSSLPHNEPNKSPMHFSESQQLLSPSENHVQKTKKTSSLTNYESNPNSPLQDQKNSPILTINKFKPLFRPKTSSSSSSLDSGPTFPPGFESTIPTPIKFAHEVRRLRKLKKKKLKREKKSKPPIIYPHQPSPSSQHLSPPSSNPPCISTDDVITFANKLGLSFPGPQSELRNKIDEILASQKADWLTNNQ